MQDVENFNTPAKAKDAMDRRSKIWEAAVAIIASGIGVARSDDAIKYATALYEAFLKQEGEVIGNS